MSAPSLDVVAILGQASPVVKITIALLGLLSVGSWAVIFQKFLVLGRVSRRFAKTTAVLASAPSPTAAAKALDGPCRDPFPEAAAQVCRLAGPETTAPPPPDLEQRLSLGLERLDLGASRQTRLLARGLGFLAACAGSSPFIGLFGTVWGVMASFNQIGQAQAATFVMVAPGVSEALLATAAGLFVAIPAAMAHAGFAAWIEALEQDMDILGQDLMLRLRQNLMRTDEAGEKP